MNQIEIHSDAKRKKVGKSDKIFHRIEELKTNPGAEDKKEVSQIKEGIQIAQSVQRKDQVRHDAQAQETPI